MTGRGLAHNENGTAAIEFAIVFPVLIVVLLGILDVGRLIWTYTTLEKAVQAAGLCVATKQCSNGLSIRAAVFDALNPLPQSPAQVDISKGECGILITSSYVFEFAVPLIAPTTTVEATTCVPV